jgi:hypothetical protein
MATSKGNVLFVDNEDLRPWNMVAFDGKEVIVKLKGDAGSPCRWIILDGLNEVVEQSSNQKIEEIPGEDSVYYVFTLRTRLPKDATLIPAATIEFAYGVLLSETVKPKIFKLNITVLARCPQ